MPDTFVGLVLFVLFLAPGICYTVVRETRRPQRELSSLRELASVLLAGVACNLGAAAVLTFWRRFWPGSTPNVGEFARGPGVFLGAHFAQTAEWGLGLLFLACGFGILLGVVDIPRPKFLRGPIKFDSAWYLQLNRPDDLLYCGCQLDDGAWMEGYLYSFNSDVEETADRELVLTQPRYRPSGSSEEPQGLEVGSVIISARRMTYLTITAVTESSKS